MLPQNPSLVNPRPASQWGVHWKSPTLMLLFYSLAVGCGLGHHLLYQSLDGQVPKNQQWYFRAGTALAVTAKLFLAASVGIVFAQRAWATARSQFLTLQSLDVLFGAINDPLSLTNTKLLSSAKLALLLTTIVWASPLITIFTPGSLTIVQQAVTTHTHMTVPTLNLTFVNSLVSNTTTGTLDFIETQVNSGKMVLTDYSGPSKAGLAIIYQTVYQGRIANANSVCSSANCSFVQSFGGPMYRCEDVDARDPLAPWCHGTYDMTQHPNGSCTELPPETQLYRADNSTVNGTDDGRLWVMYRYFPPDSRGNESWFDPTGRTRIPTSKYQNITFRCELWDTWFDVRRAFINTQQQIEANITYLAPIDMNSNKNAANWPGYAIHNMLLSIFRNSLELDFIPQYGWAWAPSEGLDLAGTPFVEHYPWRTPIDWLPGPNFRQQLEELSANITLSLLSMDNLKYLYPQTNTAVEVTTLRPAYSYDRRALLITYGAGMAAGLFAIVVRIKSFLDNGVSMKIGFLSIMTTTRNPILDGVAQGACLGAEGTMDSLMDMKVRFGEVQTQQVINGKTTPREQFHAAFGLQNGEIGDLRTDREYI